MIPHSRPTLGDVGTGELTRLLEGGHLARGAQCRTLEREFCRSILGASEGSSVTARAVQSGTSALRLALSALARLRPVPVPSSQSPEVVTTSLACAAVVHAIRDIGAKPVLCDTLPDGNLNPDLARERASARTLAFVVPHLYGKPVDLRPLLSTRIPVVEDCAQSLGVEGPAGRVGTSGAVMMTSFYATKLICTGQGGLVASSDRALMKEVERSCCYDGTEDPQPAWNENLSDWAAMLAVPQVSQFEGFLSARKKIAERYTKAFEAYSDCFELPFPDSGFGHSWYRYVIRMHGSSEDWSRRLAELGVEAKRPVFCPLHRIFGFSGDFPVAEDAWRQSLSIPIYPTLSEKEQKRVIDAVGKVAEERMRRTKW